jgi:hypothetical protein
VRIAELGAQRLQRKQAGFGRLRRRVAAIEEGVDGDRHAGGGHAARERSDMRLVGMHAARRNKAEQVAGAAIGLQLGDQIGQGTQRRQAAVGNRRIDADKILHHHAAGSEIHVSDFGIAELAFGQANFQRRGLEQAVRAGRHQAVENRRRGLGDRVVVALQPVAPAIENAQNNGAGTRHDRLIAGNGVDNGAKGGLAGRRNP